MVRSVHEIPSSSTYSVCKMEMFQLISVVATWISFTLSGFGLASQQPPPQHQAGISIIAVVGIGNRSVTPDPHVILPVNTTLTALRCQARLPVMWTIESLEGKEVIGTSSQRIVGNFHDKKTYEFSMTLKLELEPDWQPQDEQKFECVSVATDGPLGAAVSIKRDASLGAFILSLRTHPRVSNVSRDMSSISNPNMTLSFGCHDESIPFWGLNESPELDCVTCRLGAAAAEVWLSSSSTSPHLKVERGVCDQPLMCLTANYKVNSQRTDMSAHPMTQHDRKVFAIGTTTRYDLDPTVYTCCHVNTTASDSESRAHLLLTHNNSFASLEFRIASESDWLWTNSRKENATAICVGDVLRLRCQGTPFLYASGALLHSEFKNGAETFVRNETAGNPANFEFSIPIKDTNLTRVSCQFPPWNSTEWVTVSLALDVRVSSPPVSISSSGAIATRQHVSFFSQQSIVLDCDFIGVPTPEFEWKVTSDVYSMNWESKVHQAYRRKENVTVSDEYLKSGGLGPIPAANFECTAYNMAGNATKFFSVQATRSFVPTMVNTARQAVVMYTGDRGKGLNCSLSQGVPAPVFRWEVHGVDIADLDNRNYEQSNHGGLVSELVFKKVGLDDEAEFACIATNFLGSIRKEFSVRVRERSSWATVAATAWFFITAALILLLLGFAFVAYLQFKQSKKIWTLENFYYSKRHQEDGGAESKDVAIGGDSLDL